MTKLIHLDIAALLILVIILISQFTRRMSKGTTNHFFIALVIMTILSGAADIWALCWTTPGRWTWGFALRLIRSIYWHTTPFPRCSHVCYQPYKHMGKDHVKQGRRVCAYTSIPGCYRTACVKSVHALHLYICWRRVHNDAAFFSSIYNGAYQYSDKHSVYYNLP